MAEESKAPIPPLEIQPTPEAPIQSPLSSFCCFSHCSRKTLLVFLVISVMAVVLGVGYLVGGAKVFSPQGPLPVSPQITPHSTPTPGPTAYWKTYNFHKSYKAKGLSFQISYPQEWPNPKENNENTEWYNQDKSRYIFKISWYNPDVIYDIEGLCRPNMCNKVDEVITKDNNLNIIIWKPTKERKEQFNLADSYLYANIDLSGDLSSDLFYLEFSTTNLSANEFNQILSTFRFD